MVVTAGVLTPFEIEFLYHIQRDCAWFMLVRLYAQHTILYSSLLPFYFFNLGLQKSQLRHEVLNKTIHFSSKDDMRKKASFTFTQWWKTKKKSSNSLSSRHLRNQISVLLNKIAESMIELNVFVIYNLFQNMFVL